MSVNWVRIYNRLFEIIDDQGDTYFSGPRFISKVREEDPYFHSYAQYMRECKRLRKSTSRREYFYDILTEFEESARFRILQSILDEVRDSMPDKVSALEKELPDTHSIKPLRTTQDNEKSINPSVETIGHVDSPTTPHHDAHAPTAKLSRDSDDLKLEKTGWVGSLARFRKTLGSNVRKTTNLFSQFWLTHWKWIIGTAITVAALIVTYIKG